MLRLRWTFSELELRRDMIGELELVSERDLRCGDSAFAGNGGGVAATGKLETKLSGRRLREGGRGLLEEGDTVGVGVMGKLKGEAVGALPCKASSGA